MLNMNVFKKIINRLKKYSNKIYSFFFIKLFFDKEKILKLEKLKFSSLNLNYDKSINLLNSVIEKKEYDPNTDSIHWLLAAAFSLKSTSDINRILEIGTYDGEFTKILALLFPSAEITTVDLPEEDPILKKLYNRDSQKVLSEYLKKQKKNTAAENIKSIKKNTFFLLDKIDPKNKFDFIWVDGGHTYPDIAWDLSNSYFLLSENGILMSDDTILHKNKYNNGYVSTDSREVLNYIAERSKVSIFHFLKRLDPHLFSLKHTRKYVTVLKK
tara:strand:+ start:758 stop:1567 length:810 start_codon:yes stop_codon:yes gene_type:complete